MGINANSLQTNQAGWQQMQSTAQRAWPSRIVHRWSGSGNWGPQRCYFNSVLATEDVGPSTNARLTINLRLWLQMRNPEYIHEVQGKSLPKAGDLLPWNQKDPFEWTKFCRAVKDKADEFWDDRFCLVNTSDCSLLDVKIGRNIVRPNVECRFQVVWSDSPANAHEIIKCFRTTNRYVLHTFVRGDDEGNGVGQFCNWDVFKFKSGAQILDPSGRTTVEIRFDPMDPSKWVYKEVPLWIDLLQMGVPHEIGHLIGLPRVGCARPSHDCFLAMRSAREKGENADTWESGANASACYKGDGPVDEMNIMGNGDAIAAWNGTPWKARLWLHTNMNPLCWQTVVDRKVPPKIL